MSEVSDAPASPDARVLDELFAVIRSRRGADPNGSWTAKLFAQGMPKIAQKTGEEAVETVIAAMRGERAEIAAESADLLYHLLVLWAEAGVDPETVWAELARRAGTSGIDEKRRRSQAERES